MGIFDGKVALVTGGGRGIGRATALLLAQEGCDVAVLARTQQEVKQVVGEIRALGRRSIALTSDLSDIATIHQTHSAVVQELGPVDILINNAGIVEPLGSTITVDIEQWTRSMQINLIGVFGWIQACVPTMLERGWGRVINVSTGAAAGKGMQNANAYSVSKAGLEMLTVNLATELSGKGVTVNALRPGTVNTAMQTHVRSQPVERVGQDIHKQFTSMYAQGTLLDPEQPARVLVNLAKGENSGEVISIYDQRGQELLAK